MYSSSSSVGSSVCVETVTMLGDFGAMLCFIFVEEDAEDVDRVTVARRRTSTTMGSDAERKASTAASCDAFDRSCPFTWKQKEKLISDDTIKV